MFRQVIDFFTTTPVPPDGVPLQEERPDTPAQILAQTVNQVAAALVSKAIYFKKHTYLPPYFLR